jgi:hypothetical protein
MAYRQEGGTLVIDGWENGIAQSPYTGISNIRNVNTSYYPGVAYVNYRRQLSTLAESGTFWYAGAHSTNIGDNTGWLFSAVIGTPIMTNPVQQAVSPAGLIYILDDSGQVWKQSAVNSHTFNLIGDAGRFQNGAGGLAYWNNYLVVFGDAMVEFCGNGTNDAGIISGNWNLTSTSSSISVFSQLLGMNSSFSSESYAFTGTVASGATSANLNSSWKGASGTYFVQFDNITPDQRSVVFTNGSTSVSWSGGITITTASSTFYMYQFRVNGPSSFVGSQNFAAGNAVTFTSTGTLPTGIVAGTAYYLVQTPDLTSVLKTFFVAASYTDYVNNKFISLVDAGSGTITMSMLPANNPPIQNTTVTNIVWGTNGIGSTSLTLPSPWLYASGQYNFVDSVGNEMLAVFTFDSAGVNLLSPSAYQDATTATYQVNILNPVPAVSQAPYRAWVSKVDGNLYFANGRFLGRILAQNQNTKFNPGIPATYVVDYGATAIAQPSDTITDLTDLRSTMIISGQKDMYTWDYVSTNSSAPVPVGEPIKRIYNVLNVIYVLAGQKGNVFIFNGSSAQILTKLPDFIAGVIDPVWSFGDMMYHRARLFIQAIAQDTSGNNILAGIFSLVVSPSLLGEQASGLTMESQNSYGLVPTAGALPNGLLIDNEPSESGQDSYYSAWSNGAALGGIDYNDTTLWQNFEPVIETDLIPVGTFFTKSTAARIEFKLDRPMVTGDQMKLYARQSLSDSYVQIGSTFTNTQLSDESVTQIFQWQWVQLKVSFKCAASGSSRIPLREIRLHQNE